MVALQALAVGGLGEETEEAAGELARVISVCAQAEARARSRGQSVTPHALVQYADLSVWILLGGRLNADALAHTVM